MLKIHLHDPYLNKRLKHPNYNFESWVAYHNIPYSRTMRDPDWIIIHPLWGSYLQHNENMLKDLPQLLKQRMSDGTTGLLFWYPYETEHYTSPSIVQQIDHLCDIIDWQVKNVILVTGNLNTDKLSPSVDNMVRATEKKFFNVTFTCYLYIL